jgi:hypothetical protein
MTLIDLLDDPTYRAAVDAIDDTQSSLKGREDDKNLNELMDDQVQQLQQETGFAYDPRN